MNYWQTKVVPRLKKVFDKDGKKAAVAEALKSFEGSKEEINKQFEEKKPELETKVVAIYEASSTEIKTLVKERKISDIKKHSDDVQKFLTELQGIDFPGAKQVCEASKTVSPALVSKPILFLLEKVSTFVVIPEVKDKELPAEEIAAATTEETATTTAVEITPETTTSTSTEPAEKEVAVVAEPVPEIAPVVSVPVKAEVAEPAKAEVVAAKPAVTPPPAKP